MPASIRLLAALAAGACLPAMSARPLITDDARIVDPKACQVESWIKRNRDSTESWALPACNPFGNAELTFGGARTYQDGEHKFSDRQIQAKTLFKPLEDDGWGVGFAIGAVRKPTREDENGLGDAYFYVPVSIAIPKSPVIVHLNLGGARHRDEKKNFVTWGVGTETTLSERVYLIAETFGESKRRPFYQAGLRFWVVKDRWQVDATYGNRGSGSIDDRWFSIGIRLLSPPFLP